MFIFGDNLAAMRELHARGERFHLIYLDPPFFTGRDFMMGDELAFSDRWDGIESYMEHLRARIAAAHSLLAPEGSLVVHVDPTVSHDVRGMLDARFGRHAFCDEIVWRYRRWPSKSSRQLQHVHDALIRYALDPERARFTQLYEDLAPSTLAVWGRKKQRAKIENWTRVKSEATAEDSPGVPLGDAWDIGIIAPSSRERTGYPTQKPEALLERVVSAFSLPGDSVLDPYSGSGTLGAVCARLGRRWVGIDSSPVAARVITQRLTCEAVSWVGKF